MIAAAQSTRKPRTYDDGPLPIKPSEKSPQHAQIVSRNEDKYHLKIGNVDIHDVAIKDILNYVSPMDLEQFENRQFAEERSVLLFLEAEKAQLKREKLERQKERAKTKGVVIFEELDSAEDTTEGGEVAVGKHGRARPTYTHLFKRPKEAKMRKRDADTDDMIPVDEDEDLGISTENEPPQVSSIQASMPISELPKRRRRKRDKVTGELLPLSPIAQRMNEFEQTHGRKRQRRRRNPLTGELMPVGWPYDPDNDGDSYEKRREGVGSHSFGQLSISEEPLLKRQRLDLKSSVSRSPSPLPTKAQLAARHTPTKAGSNLLPSAQRHSSVDHDLNSSEEDSGAKPSSVTPSNLKFPPKPMTATPKLVRPRQMSFAESSSEQDSSSDAGATATTLHPSPSKSQMLQRTASVKTSILNPSLSRASSTEPPEDDEESQEDDLDEAEWVIESILEHRLSDPTTHPEEFGTEPVMLYLVKWEGYDDPSWEPIESFGDKSIVKEYLNTVSVEGVSQQSDSDEDPTMHATDTVNIPLNSKTIEQKALDGGDEHGDRRSGGDGGDLGEDDGDDMDEDEFEVEAILSHHLSDPNTHPPELGRKPVVLYKVKWKGWSEENVTWEPASSFEDKNVLQEYHSRIRR